jgi:hypothetical protein
MDDNTFCKSPRIFLSISPTNYLSPVAITEEDLAKLANNFHRTTLTASTCQRAATTTPEQR